MRRCRHFIVSRLLPASLDRCPRGFTGHVMAAPPFHSLPEGEAERRPRKKKTPNERHVISHLTSVREKVAIPSLWEFNGGMKIKVLICAAFAGCVLGCTASLQTQTIKGTVCSCTDSQITVLEQDGKHYDIIQRTSATIIKPPMTPPCTAGTPVEVTYNSTDAQRKEDPTGTCPTSTSPSG